jgi:hypothetical protein
MSYPSHLYFPQREQTGFKRNIDEPVHITEEEKQISKWMQDKEIADVYSIMRYEKVNATTWINKLVIKADKWKIRTVIDDG